MEQTPPKNVSLLYKKNIIIIVLLTLLGVFHAWITRLIFNYFAFDQGDIAQIATWWILCFIMYFCIYSFFALFIQNWKITLLAAFVSSLPLVFFGGVSVGMIIFTVFLTISPAISTFLVTRELKERVFFRYQSLSKGRWILSLALIAMGAFSSYQGVMGSDALAEKAVVPQEAINYVTPVLQENLELALNSMVEQYGQQIPEDQRKLIIGDAIKQLRNIVETSINANLPNVRYVTIFFIIFVSFLLIPLSKIFVLLSHGLVFLALVLFKKIGWVELREVSKKVERYQW